MPLLPSNFLLSEHSLFTLWQDFSNFIPKFWMPFLKFEISKIGFDLSIKAIYWLKKVKKSAWAKYFCIWITNFEGKIPLYFWTNFRNFGHSGSFTRSIGRVSFSRFAKKKFPRLSEFYGNMKKSGILFIRLKPISANFLILSFKCIFLPTTAINELLCLKNAGTQISLFFTSYE